MVEHLSYSSINTYLSCPENWRRKYIAKEPTKASPALAFGSAFHGTIEDHLSGKGGLLSCWAENWGKQKDQDIYWGSDTPEQHYNDGVRMFSSQAVLDTIGGIQAGKDEKGAKIERKVELRVPGVEIPIIGYIDIILNDGTPSDFKTSSKSWGDGKAENEMQPLFYLAALNQMGIAHNWTFKHFVFVKLKEPKTQVLEHSHKPSELFFLFAMIQQVWKGIECEVFPANPSTWLCNPSYCDFYANCRGK